MSGNAIRKNSVKDGHSFCISQRCIKRLYSLSFFVSFLTPFLGLKF